MIAETDFFLGGEGQPSPANAAAAIILVDGSQYLMQLRDQMPNIFYPGHWGLFGGALEPGEDAEAALRRELMEELTLPTSGFRYVTKFTFDYGRFGLVDRAYYEVRIPSSSVDGLTLREGAGMRAFAAAELLRLPRLVPYDSFAVWLHASGALAP
jgi:8-oxo-dGTP pyrophosphatase MutT (NUDIX family)